MASRKNSAAGRRRARPCPKFSCSSCCRPEPLVLIRHPSLPPFLDTWALEKPSGRVSDYAAPSRCFLSPAPSSGALDLVRLFGSATSSSSRSSRTLSTPRDRPSRAGGMLTPSYALLQPNSALGDAVYMRKIDLPRRCSLSFVSTDRSCSTPQRYDDTGSFMAVENLRRASAQGKGARAGSPDSPVDASLPPSHHSASKLQPRFPPRAPCSPHSPDTQYVRKTFREAPLALASEKSVSERTRPNSDWSVRTLTRTLPPHAPRL